MASGTLGGGALALPAARVIAQHLRMQFTGLRARRQAGEEFHGGLAQQMVARGERRGCAPQPLSARPGDAERGGGIGAGRDAFQCFGQPLALRLVDAAPAQLARQCAKVGAGVWACGAHAR